MTESELRPWEKRYIDKMSRRYPKAARKKRVINKWKNQAMPGFNDMLKLVYPTEFIEQLIFGNPIDWALK